MAAKDSKAGRQDKDESVDDEVSQAAASKTKTKTKAGSVPAVAAAFAGVARVAGVEDHPYRPPK